MSGRARDLAPAAPHDSAGGSAPDVSVTIASFNARAALRRCLASLDRHRGGLELEVIVVDNASTDGSADMVSRLWPEARLVRNPANRYLAVAQNQAIGMARAPFVLVLNSDMEVMEGTLPAMVRYLRARPEVGAASCVEVLHGRAKVPLLFQTPREALLRRTWLGSRLRPGPRDFVNHRHEAGEIEAEVISDAFMMARREALASIGGFDERLRLYYTEDDVCLRLRRAGWKVHFVPSAAVVHLGAGSHSVRTVGELRILWINYGDTRRYFQKHFGRPAGLLVGSAFLAQYLLYDAPRCLRRRMVGGPSPKRAARAARRLRED